MQILRDGTLLLKLLFHKSISAMAGLALWVERCFLAGLTLTDLEVYPNKTQALSFLNCWTTIEIHGKGRVDY